MILNEEWKEIFENLPERIYILEKNLNIKKVNSIALMGKDPKEVIGKPCWEIIREKKEKCQDCPLYEKEKGELFFNHKGIGYESFFKKISSGFLLIVREIEKESIENLILMIRHSLGNALNSMKVSLQVFSDFYSRISEEKKIEYISRLLEDVRRLERFLGHLKELSYIGEYDFLDFELNAIVMEFIKRAQQRCFLLGIDFVYDIIPEKIIVHGNPDWIFSTLLVLLENSIDALKEKEKRMIELKIKREKNNLLISFFDSGKGINKEEMERAFELFFSTKERGEGVGLYQAKKMVETMGGRMWIESEEGSWTEIFIELPEG